MCNVICRSCTLRFNASHDPSIPGSGLVLRAGTVTPVSESQAAYLKNHPLVDLLEAPAPTPAPLPVALSDTNDLTFHEESSL